MRSFFDDKLGFRLVIVGFFVFALSLFIDFSPWRGQTLNFYAAAITFLGGAMTIIFGVVRLLCCQATYRYNL